MKNRSINMLIVAFCALACMAVALIFFIGYAHERFEDGITVTENGVTESVMEVRDLVLTPTAKKEYHVNLYCEATGGYNISLDYREKHDGGMKNFVVVKVSLGDKQVYEGMLSELLDEDITIDFPGELHADDPLTLTFSYEMPREIGNEAQGTSADFDIVIKIKKD